MSQANRTLESLFQPIKLSEHLSLDNRVVMAPMTRCRSDDEQRLANDLMRQYYEQRATAGLIITEGIFVSPMAAGYIRVPGLYTREQANSWKPITTSVHEKGGKIFAQLWHTGRISHPDFHGGRLPLAPSAINPHFRSYTYRGHQDTVTPKAMSVAEIQATITDFQTAAANAMLAGFDGVELHAANGYLFHQFLAACANVREDEYGGSIPNRCRFLLETITALQNTIGAENIAVRLNPDLNDSFGITADDTTQPTFDYLIRELNRYPLAYLHLSGFSKSKKAAPFESILATAACYRKIYQGALMINRGFDADTGASTIADGLADMVSFGVPFIANPDLVARFRRHLPVAGADRSTFYTAGAKGYIDYPPYPQK